LSEKRKNDKKLPKPSVVSGSPMDVDLLSKIVELMTENDVNTVDVRDGQKRVVIKRGAAAFPPTMMSPGYAMPAMQTAAPTAGAPGPASRTKAGEEGSGEDESKLLRIKSPMVGTFYAAPSKGAKPFVTVGTKVEEDSDVCIIEAMKVFNNIKAECRGTITRVLVQDSQPVEFGQTLFLVKPE
jgi:acetyl-CoA carboxylase biotin carboxyl carrier protein